MSPKLDEFARNLLAELLLQHPLPKPPTLEWKAFRTTAGMADFGQWAIFMGHKVLLDEQQVEITLRHEYAHLLAFSRFGRRAGRGHGPAWQQAMRELGLPPTVRHTYEVERNQRRQLVVYKCSRCGSDFHRNRRLPRNKRYAHLGCGGELVLSAVLPATNDSPGT